MASMEDIAQSPNDDRKPKSILKNAGQTNPLENHVSPIIDTPDVRPGVDRGMSEKEITQLNTNINAGEGNRRGSADVRATISRRQSGVSQVDATSPRLKWDEANLYLNEGQMGGKMKIDEPKTPYAGRYDPSEDDEDASAIDPSAIAVDELELGGAVGSKHKKSRHTKEDDIPGLNIGEPSIETLERHNSEGERRVILDPDRMDMDGARHGEEPANMSSEEREQHRQFSEMRKKHYEMKNVKNILGHSDNSDGE